MERNHPESGIHLTYIGTPSDAGDQYAGLDRFGRVVDQNWTNGTSSVDRYAYGYDRNGNRLYKENQLSAANSELYAYDNLNRLTTMQRGTLDGAKTGLTGSATRSQAWDLDALGNSNSVSTDSVAQTREHNAQNQLTDMGSNTLAFDANGNETTDETGKTLVYDAWNRLVEAKNGSTSLVRYGHDALTRRIQEDTTAVYHTAGWQAIEERNSSGQLTQQYVWSPLYVDALIERDRDTNADGTADERVYVLQDANFNVTAIVDDGGSVLERFQYDAYGTRTVLDTNWTATADAYSFMHGHQGGEIDAITNYVHFRNRDLNTVQMRWLQQDPLTYVDGPNLYQVTFSSPLNYIDAVGLAGAGRHHWYPLYLGGARLHILSYLGPKAHNAVHGYLCKKFPYGNGGREAWRALSEFRRAVHLARTMKMAGFGKPFRSAMIPRSFAGSTPGVRTMRFWGGVASGAALTILTSPSTAWAAELPTSRERARNAFSDPRDEDGDGIPAGFDPDDRVPTTCPAILVLMEQSSFAAKKFPMEDVYERDYP